MRRFRWLGLAATLLLSTTAFGQAPSNSDSQATGASSVTSHLSENMTPEMWLYTQEAERHKDPKEAVRRKAELRSSQRQRRLESQRWFGVINLRPTANPVPYYGSYSPSWQGNGSNGYSWRGVGQPHVTYHSVSIRR